MYKYMPQTCESENNYKERLYISHDISVYNATFFFSLSLFPAWREKSENQETVNSRALRVLRPLI